VVECCPESVQRSFANPISKGPAQIGYLARYRAPAISSPDAIHAKHSYRVASLMSHDMRMSPNNYLKV
jgi:hypothetical protein